MLIHMGTKIIETQRLILRQFREEDAEEMFNNWASDAEVTKYLTWPTHSDIEASKKILLMWTAEYGNNENYNWAIEIKESRRLIGSIGFVNIDNFNENCEIGYCISKAYWNKGITTEAFSAIINFAFKEVGFERITGRHHVENTASGCVMEKCGLKYEGTLRKIHRINTGQLVDCKYYSILKEEFLKMNYKVERTNTENPDFRVLEKKLDEELCTIYGKMQSKYSPNNIVIDLKTILIYDGQNPIACGCLKLLSGDLAEVKRVFVSPENRGKGISKIVMKELEKWAIDSNIKALILETGSKQEAAINLYRAWDTIE